MPQDIVNVSSTNFKVKTVEIGEVYFGRHLSLAELFLKICFRYLLPLNYCPTISCLTFNNYLIEISRWR